MKKFSSQYFRIKLKLLDEPAYRVAHRCKVDPNFISKFINKIQSAEEDDPRILAVAKAIGLEAGQIFEK